MSCDELHDECEIIVRSIVEVDWQSIVLLVERELEIALGATGANVLFGFEAAYPSLPRGVFTCYMCMMTYLVVLQFHMAEGSHGCCTKVLLDLRYTLQWQFIKEILFHTLLQLNQILHERTKILFALVWCMEDSQLGINGWLECVTRPNRTT